eukprot:TRINITY_DN129_c0_g2_i1.p1 TRINITY_DN129_c0_g2~~TRINITY_DN129_c0_g2_i1.p1  ORF type:complete len:406 (+),score=44.32 TRINITY_DN129_c0_g2_i1:70-1218(+)
MGKPVIVRRPPEHNIHELAKRIDKLEAVQTEAEEDGEWEDGELSQDVYATAFLLAKNATPGMYTFNPLKNKDIALVWAALIFIAFSQVFALLAISVLFPPVVRAESFLVECGDPTDPSYEKFTELSTPYDCTSFAVEFQILNKTLHRIEWEQFYYQGVFSAESFYTVILQIICCTWVLCAVYYRINERVSAMFAFADFNNYFLPLKGETVRNENAVLLVPLLQWTLNTMVASVSCCVICGYTDAVDIVLNSLAFTFISEVPEYFNEPLVKYYSTTAVRSIEQGGQLDTAEYGTAPIFFLYPEYDEANYDPSNGGWYILKSHKRPGLLSDYSFRHDPSKYPRRAVRLIPVLSKLFWAIPVLSVAGCHLFFTGQKQFPNVVGCA